MTYFLFFMIGSSFTSFFQVLISQWQDKKPHYFRASTCQSCRSPLKSYHLIPIFSFLYLKGRCHKCRGKIPRKLFFGECLGGSLFTLLYHFHAPFFLFFWLTGAFFFSLEDASFKEISFFPALCFHFSLLFFAFFHHQPFYLLSTGYLCFLWGVGTLFFRNKLGQGDWLILFFWSFFCPFPLFLWLLTFSCLLAIPVAFLKKGPLPFIPFLTISLLFCQLYFYN